MANIENLIYKSELPSAALWREHFAVLSPIETAIPVAANKLINVMGSDDVQTSIAHLVLCCVAGNGLGRNATRSYVYPGMHANFFIHGVLGFFHHQSGIFDNDFKPAYLLSLKATRYLALPCLMADLYRDDTNLSAIHLASGVVPFVLAIAEQDNAYLGNLLLACNIVSLGYYSMQHNNEWGWYTTAAALLAYFVTPTTNVQLLYPLTLALMEYCAFRVIYNRFLPPPPAIRPRR